MDFITETFPDARIHISLFRLAADSEQAAQERKQKLAELL
jgi:hypothetical protein